MKEYGSFDFYSPKCILSLMHQNKWDQKKDETYLNSRILCAKFEFISEARDVSIKITW